MEAFPWALVLALVFGVVLLLQPLIRLVRRVVTMPDAGPGTETSPGRDSQVLRTVATAVPLRPLAVLAPPGAVAHRPGPQARRFSRRSLMGSRRALQEAMVVAAILGPCRTHQPHRGD